MQSIVQILDLSSRLCDRRYVHCEWAFGRLCRLWLLCCPFPSASRHIWISPEEGLSRRRESKAVLELLNVSGSD